MKNISIALTLGILLISSALIVSIPKNIVAQQQEDPVDPKLTKEEIQAKITDFKTKHPKYAAIVEEIPNLDLKETVKGYLAAGAVQKMLKFHAKNLVEERVANATGASSSSPLDEYMTDEQIQTKVADFKAKHPKFAAIVGEIPNLDLKETVKGYLAAGAIQKMLKFHAKNLVEEKVANTTGSASAGSSPLDEAMTDEQIQTKVTDFKTKHPKFAAIVEGISNLDLKETVKAYLGAEVLQKLFKYHAKNLVQEAVTSATP